MAKPLFKLFTFVCIYAASSSLADAQLTIDANFTTSDTSDFPGSTPISSDPNAATIESTIDQAISQITTNVTCNSPITISIEFEDDPNTSLGENATPSMDLAYSQYLSDLEANPHKSSNDTTALGFLPAGPGVGFDHNATQISFVPALLDAIGDTTDGNSLISGNNGFAGAVGLNISTMNPSRNPYDPSKYDLFSTVTHEVDEILGIGGDGSNIVPGTLPADIGPLDLFRYGSKGVRSFSNSANVGAYFSINGGATDLVHFNQDSGGDFGDWGDGVVPADGNGNSPPLVQDAFGDSTAEPNIGPPELTALDVVGWNLTPAGMALDGIPEPGSVYLLLPGLALIGALRKRVPRNGG